MLEVLVSTQTKAFLIGLDDRNIGVHLALEALVFAAVSATAILGALHLGGPVDTVRILAAGMIGLGVRVYK